MATANHILESQLCSYSTLPCLTCIALCPADFDQLKQEGLKKFIEKIYDIAATMDSATMDTDADSGPPGLACHTRCGREIP